MISFKEILVYVLTALVFIVTVVLVFWGVHIGILAFTSGFTDLNVRYTFVIILWLISLIFVISAAIWLAAGMALAVLSFFERIFKI